MKNKLLKTIGTTALAILILTIFGQTRLLAQENSKTEDQSATQTMENISFDGESDKTLTGVWETFVTQRNCLTGAPVAPELQGLQTYDAGGTLSEFGGNNLRSPGHGIWQRAQDTTLDGRRSFSMKFIFLRFNASGVFLGKQRITQTIRLSTAGDSYSSSGTVEVLDLSGNVIGSGCATATATRFE